MTITQPTHFPETVRPAAPTTAQGDPRADATAGPRGGDHMYGACSIETFCNAGSLAYTHEDADGFLAYVRQFNAPNFWFQDSGVKIWEYYEDFDNWQDTYGLDAVRAFYHSGHGGMDANGVFYAPMGAAWAGNDCTAVSSTMRLGNEYLRYLFWSTCESLRVHGGHSPLRTWSAANLGLRMILGFETVSWDDSRYGSGFWRHWRAGESFSNAWLNASWDIAHDQAPSAVAFGATPQEAQDRVFNERAFFADRVSSNWWWWRYYDVAASARREGVRRLPADLRVAALAPLRASSTDDLAQRFGVDPSTAQYGFGVTTMGSGPRRVTVDDGGAVRVVLATANRENRSPIGHREALTAADGAVRAFGLDRHGGLVLDRVVDLREAGASRSGDGELEGPFTTGTMVQYRQVIGDLPVITPGAGAVRLVVDNDGQVTEVDDTTRAVDALSDRPRARISEPTPPGAAPSAGPTDYDAALARAFGRRLRRITMDGPAPLSFGVVPGTTEIGYDVQGSDAVVVAQRAVEVEFDGGFRKRYWVKAPLFG